MCISWMDKIPSMVVLSHTGLPSMYTLFWQCRLRWLGHVRGMEDSRIPKDILYVELVEGKRGAGRPQHCFHDVCKRDMKALSMDTLCWEALAADHSKWCNNLLRSTQPEIRPAGTCCCRWWEKSQKKKTGAIKPSQFTVWNTEGIFCLFFWFSKIY